MYIKKLESNGFTLKELILFALLDRDGHLEFTLNNMYIELTNDELFQLKEDIYNLINGRLI